MAVWFVQGRARLSRRNGCLFVPVYHAALRHRGISERSWNSLGMRVRQEGDHARVIKCIHRSDGAQWQPRLGRDARLTSMLVASVCLLPFSLTRIREFFLQYLCTDQATGTALRQHRYAHLLASGSPTGSLAMLQRCLAPSQPHTTAISLELEPAAQSGARRRWGRWTKVKSRVEGRKEAQLSMCVFDSTGGRALSLCFWLCSSVASSTG